MDGEGLSLLIVQLVLEVLETQHLLPCRLVNHSWNEIATRLLVKAGWEINLSLRGMERFFGNLTNKGYRVCSLPMALEAKFYGAWTTGNNLAIEKAIKTLENWPESPIKSLSVHLPHGGLPPSLAKLIWVYAPALRRLSIRIADQVPDTDQFKSIFALPALKCVSVTGYHVKPSSLLSFIQPYLMRAKDLEILRLDTALKENEVCGELALLSEIHAADSHKLSKLIELDVEHFGQLQYLRLIDGVRFSQLHTLRIGSWRSSIPTVIHRHCPVLRVLEIRQRFEEEPAHEDTSTTTEHDILSGITHFVFNKAPLYRSPRCGYAASQFDWRKELRGVESFLRMITSFPNLTSVDLRFENLLALYHLFTHLGGNVEAVTASEPDPTNESIPPTFLASKWPHLKRLSLKLMYDELECVTGPRMRFTCWLINEMFPNLERLCLTLGDKGDRFSLAYPTNGGLYYALALVFGLRTVKHAEISPHYWSWDFRRLRAEQRMRLVTNNSDLGSITIRVVKKSVEVQPIPWPRIYLDLLREIVPEQPNFLLELDSRIPVSLTLGEEIKPYNELVMELESLSNPRVALM